ncbi:hypothetical protein NADFUDRAFT_30554 [Nadsonia fulvescens var. elongata DSM 6958]|uniref:Histone deacetylase interacting domain-containing protein n=1 Tax=Nadsonia fulvescens var. elongata DSM 6958 TaxID=857566 RepID=A0A1E3PS83_9ASCO|nr:hypothetical protein NADFUDRAFT_30554 [Nadsonia fulvescens var. elongata DSM 6958]
MANQEIWHGSSEDGENIHKQLSQPPQPVIAPPQGQAPQGFHSTQGLPVLPPPSALGSGPHSVAQQGGYYPPISSLPGIGNTNGAPAAYSGITGGHGLSPSPAATNAPSAALLGSYRPLNVKDALSYLDQVKIQFQNQPDVYNHFLDIMKDFKTQSIDTPGVIDRVSTLFRGHPNLIQGFNTFLPTGYHIECSMDPSDPNPIRVTTPMGTTTRPGSEPMSAFLPENRWPTQEGYMSYVGEPNVIGGSMSQLHAAANGRQPVNELRRPGGPVEFNHAISYVNKIKNRFVNQPDIYKNFLEILQTYQREQKPLAEVYSQVTILFKEAPDLLDDFKQFLPDTSQQPQPPQQPRNMHDMYRLPPVGNFAPPAMGSLPREAEQVDRRDRASISGISNGSIAHNGSINDNVDLQGIPHGDNIPISHMRSSVSGKFDSSSLKTKDGVPVSPKLIPAAPAPLEPTNQNEVITEEVTFFDRAKKFIGRKQTYNEFLKVLNLFSQGLIDKNVLVERVEGFLGANPDLMDWFKQFIRYDGKPLHIDQIVFKKHQLELSLCKSYGPSYRLLPKTETFMPCSGRDEMCWEVLNDEWVGHPTWASEDSGFVAHRKNQYEEVLHRVEEERHEYDFYIEANLRTIQTLETIANRIANMTSDEKATFKLPVGLGHTSTIYQKVVKKIYDKQRGLEVINALHENPAIAVPVVLRRLKQKDEEWKRAHREWNKVWRETEQKVFYKSLDHRGLTFKQTDKRFLTTKQLVAEISIVKTEQTNRKVNQWTPKPVDQLNYIIEDFSIFSDIYRLMKSFLTNSNTYSVNDREKIEVFYKSFVTVFFDVSVEELIGASKSLGESSVKKENLLAPSPTTGSKRKDIDTDLLRSILRKAKYSINSKRKPDSDGVHATGANDAEGELLPDEIEQTGEPWIQASEKSEASTEDNSKKRAKYNLFGNTAIYIFFRYLQVIYERLKEVKDLESTVVNDIVSKKPIDFAVDFDLYDRKLQDMGLAFGPEGCYDQLLRLSEKLIEGEVEHQWFEETLRQTYRNRAYKLFTIDKVIQNFTKHINAIISDQKSSDALVLFENDRNMSLTTVKKQIIYRLRVRSVIGSDENMFRIEWNDAEKRVAIQYIGPDSPSVSLNSQTEEEKWNYYVTSYIMANPTEGVSNERVELPFLKISLDKAKSAQHSEYKAENEHRLDATDSNRPYFDYIKAGLLIRICMNTYKMFFEPNTEDVFIKRLSQKDILRAGAGAESTQRQTKWNSVLSSRWKKNLSKTEAQICEEKYDEWIKNGPDALESFEASHASESDHEGGDNKKDEKHVERSESDAATLPNTTPLTDVESTSASTPVPVIQLEPNQLTKPKLDIIPASTIPVLKPTINQLQSPITENSPITDVVVENRDASDSAASANTFINNFDSVPVKNPIQTAGETCTDPLLSLSNVTSDTTVAEKPANGKDGEINTNSS